MNQHQNTILNIATARKWAFDLYQLGGLNVKSQRVQRGLSRTCSQMRIIRVAQAMRLVF